MGKSFLEPCDELNQIDNPWQVQTLQPGDALGRHMQPTEGESDFEELKLLEDGLQVETLRLGTALGTAVGCHLQPTAGEYYSLRSSQAGATHRYGWWADEHRPCEIPLS